MPYLFNMPAADGRVCITAAFSRQRKMRWKKVSCCIRLGVPIYPPLTHSVNWLTRTAREGPEDPRSWNVAPRNILSAPWRTPFPPCLSVTSLCLSSALAQCNFVPHIGGRVVLRASFSGSTRWGKRNDPEVCVRGGANAKKPVGVASFVAPAAGPTQKPHSGIQKRRGKRNNPKFRAVGQTQ